MIVQSEHAPALTEYAVGAHHPGVLEPVTSGECKQPVEEGV